MYSSAAPSGSRHHLRLMAYLALAAALIATDHQGGWLTRAREAASVAIVPIWWLAGLPARLFEEVGDALTTRAALAEDNQRLRNELLLASARQARLLVEAGEAARLRGLLGALEDDGLEMQLAPVLDAELDPTRQRLLLAAGSRAGIVPGQSVIDAGGLLGQVIATTPTTASVLLVTDLDHAIPVLVVRSGVRLTAYGSGRSDRLELRNIPHSSDINVGDTLVTSGLGGRFPPGFPVGTVVQLTPDETQTFLVGELTPAAQPDHGRDVLVLHQIAAERTDADAGDVP